MHVPVAIVLQDRVQQPRRLSAVCYDVTGAVLLIQQLIVAAGVGGVDWNDEWVHYLS